MNSKFMHILLFIIGATSLLLFASACEEPTSELAVVSLDVTPPTILAGQKFHVEAEVRNESEQTKTFDVPVMVNGIAQDRKSVTLEPGETKKIEFSIHRDNAGTYTIRIGSQNSTLEVRKPIPPTFKLSNLEIKPTEINIGDKVVITADIANVGEIQGEYTAELKINGVTDQTDEKNILPGSSSFVVFVIYPDSQGIYKITIGELIGQLSVLAPVIPIQATPPACPPATKWNATQKC